MEGMRYSPFALFASVSLILGAFSIALPAQADTATSTVPSAATRRLLLMGDGRWYDPTSGLSEASEAALRILIDPPAETIPPVTSVSALIPEVPPPALRRLLQMGDGRWYDPTSGLSANTESALRLLIDPPPATSGTSASLPDQFPLLQAIRRGQDLLRDALLQPTTTVTSVPDWAPVRLAVWHSASDTIDLIDIEKQGRDIRSNDPRADEINVLFARQLQSQYGLTSNTDLVVAIRYPLYNPIKKGTKTIYEREDVVYSPYSPALDTTDMVKYGHAWLEEGFKQVEAELRASGVKSRFDPTKLIADVISPDVAKAILLIEHTDEISLTRDPSSIYSRMLITVAANGTSSYAYDDSHVGAQGFAQFMPSTYSLVAQDSRLGLPKNVEEGTRNFYSAVKAQVVYLDRLWSVMPNEVKQAISTNPDRAAEYVVAAYNGGEGRIQKAVAVWGDDWSDPDVSVTKKAAQDVTNAKAAVTKATKAVKAAKAGAATTAAKKTLATANTTLANAQARLSRLQAATLRDETIGYVAKFRQALKGIRQVAATLNGGTPNVSIASTGAATKAE